MIDGMATLIFMCMMVMMAVGTLILMCMVVMMAVGITCDFGEWDHDADVDVDGNDDSHRLEGSLVSNST